MEKSSCKKVFRAHMVSSSNMSREKRRLAKEPTRKSRTEMFWRRGSKILPDFFPPDKLKRKTLNHQTILPVVKRISIVKQYSWENEESGESEAQTIAKSWMMYFGFGACETWSSYKTLCCSRRLPEMQFYFIRFLKMTNLFRCLNGTIIAIIYRSLLEHSYSFKKCW